MVEAKVPEDKKADAARKAVEDAATGELVTQGVKSLREMVEMQVGEIAKALPNGTTAQGERYARTILTEIRKNPKLLEVSPPTFFGAILTAAQMGLEFGPLGQAYIVPFKNRKKINNQWVDVLEAQLIIGYKGWLSLMDRSSQIESISARTVYQGDEFEYEYGLDERLVHRPIPEDKRGPITHYYCVVRKTNGGRSFIVMTQHEVEAHRERYAKKNFDGKFTGPWADKDQFESMAYKSCLLKLKTWIPMNVDTQLAQEVERGTVTRMTAAEESIVEPFDEASLDDGIVDAVVVGSEEDRDNESEEERIAREADEAWKKDGQ
jgi:recombination protein RecT